MKAILFKNPSSESQSFLSQEDCQPHFYDRLHFHPEIQLTYISASEGTAVIGDKIDRFAPGDLYILGPNLPHVFRNDKEYFEEDSGLEAHCFSIYFKQDSFGPQFFQMPEFNDMRKMFELCSRGIRIRNNEKSICNAFNEIQQAGGMDRFILLMQLLHKLSSVQHFEILSGFSYSSPGKESHNARINKVFDFVMENFTKSITLEEGADLVFMSPASFSRYFKQHTRKTFTQFVNEVRVGRACKLIMEKELDVAEIAYRCGFNNLSNFNRQFKRITGFAPRIYRENQKSLSLSKA